MQSDSLFKRLIRHEAAGGVVLMIAAAIAMIIANSPLNGAYQGLFNKTFSVLIDGHGLSKPIILWVNDGLMAIFFFLIGLELKREVLEGKLRNPRDIILPGFAALGGMAVPALIFAALNWNSPATLPGWAIPAATDIAFAVGVLALLGKRAPASLKVFLLTLAILDDLGAIIIIAVFYTAKLDVTYLALALIPLAGLLFHNRRRAHRIAPIVLLGAMLWVLVLESGVHATLAGVITAFFVPLKDRFGKSPMHALEHGLEPYVKFLILPLFAFANAGVVLAGMTIGDLAAPLPSGIALGLLIGKLTGVFGFTWLLVKSGAARLPEGANWLHIFGVAALAGIGFTMSLFIGSLSFSDLAQMNAVRLGVLTGSILSACLGFAVLFAAGPARP
jgi:Na+:H+ antiporter, NhaA family